MTFGDETVWIRAIPWSDQPSQKLIMPGRRSAGVDQVEQRAGQVRAHTTPDFVAIAMLISQSLKDGATRITGEINRSYVAKTMLPVVTV
jgi:hypothetical protein